MGSATTVTINTHRGTDRSHARCGFTCHISLPTMTPVDLISLRAPLNTVKIYIGTTPTKSHVVIFFGEVDTHTYIHLENRIE